MERASSTLQGPRDDIIVPLLHLTVFLCLAMSVMLFVEKVYMAIIILVKLFRKRPGRHPERRYIWEPMHEKDEVLIQIPMCNEKEVYQLSIGAACGLLWTSDRIIIQVLDDSTDPVIKARVVECNKEEVMEEREGGRRKRGGDMVEERKSHAKRRKEGPTLAGESKDEVEGEITRESEDEVKGERTRQDDEGRKKRMTREDDERRKKRMTREDDERRKKRKQQCRGVKSCMAMGCAAIVFNHLLNSLRVH